MRIYTEDFSGYTPWAGAVDVFLRIKNQGKLDHLAEQIDEIFEDGALTETELNDLLWFEPWHVTLPLGVASLEEIEDEIVNGGGLDAFLDTWLEQVSHVDREELLELCMQYADEDRREEIAEIIGA